MMEASTAPEAPFDFDSPETEEFLRMMEETVLDSDLVRIDWLLERIRKAQAEIAENNEIADRRIAMQEDFRQGENRKLDRLISWATGAIGTLAPASGKDMKSEYGKKSRTLAHGTFGWHMVKGERIEIEDAEKALAYAKANDLEIHLVPAQKSVTKTTLKAHAKDTGTLEGEGWSYHDDVDGFYVKPAK